MPKYITKLSTKLNKIVSQHPEFTTDGCILLCGVCCKSISYDGTHGADRLRSHIASSKHQNNKLLHAKTKQVTILEGMTAATTSQKIVDTFSRDLTVFFVEANIPIYKVNHPSAKLFFSKYIKHHIPDESTLRKYYVKAIFEECIANIKADIGEEDIFIVVDESTDAEKRYIFNILIGKLNGEFHKPKLICSKSLEEVNSVSVCQIINDTMRIIWSDQIHYERLKLVVSDQAAYMVKAMKSLKCMYPHLSHVTCLAHALHRVSEKIREDHDETNRLVSSITNILSKSPYRRQLYKTTTGLCLPPDVVITRWGTWLTCCFYLKKNLSAVKSFIGLLEGETKSRSIATAKKIIESNKVEDELIYINRFNCIVEGIKNLEALGLTLKEQVNIVNQIKSKLSGNPAAKLKSSLSKNPDFVSFTNPLVSYEDRCKRQYAPLVSVDVERSFSRHKNILQDNRRCLTVQNLEMLTILNYNSIC